MQAILRADKKRREFVIKQIYYTLTCEYLSRIIILTVHVDCFLLIESTNSCSFFSDDESANTVMTKQMEKMISCWKKDKNYVLINLFTLALK